MLRAKRGRTTRAQVRQALERQIREGDYPPGAHLEPIRALAERHGVSYVTMRRALVDLQDAGLVHLQRGAGVFVGEAAGAGARPSQPRAALVLPTWMERHSYDYVPRVLHGFLPAAEACGVRVELVAAAGQGVDPTFLDTVLARRPDAVVWLSPIFAHQMNLVRLVDRGIPVVTTGRRFPNAPFTTVTVDVSDLAERFMGWAAARSAPALDFIGFTSDGISEDPASVDYGDALTAAGARAGVSVVRHVQPRTASAAMLREALTPAAEPHAYAVMAEQFLEPLAALARDGFWPRPDQLTVFDVIGRGAPSVPDSYAGMQYVCARAPLERIGAAVARQLELALVGSSGLPEPDLRVALLTGTPLRPARLAPLT
jgi:DNA-binding LacI/PurR family transcriptional regulator